MTPPLSQPAVPPVTRILLVADHALLCRGLVSLIETEPDLAVCAQAASRQAALTAIASAKPDLVITDLSLDGGDGLDLVKDIKRQFPGLPVLVLSMHPDALFAERALRAGARGYVTKQDIDAIVITAIRCVLAGQVHTSEALGRPLAQKYMAGGTLAERSGIESLSDRELAVFRLISEGRPTRAIAQALDLSVKTIESHRENLKSKLGLRSGADLNCRAVRWQETGRLE